MSDPGSATIKVLLDAFERVTESVHFVVAGLEESDLVFRVDAQANSIAWLLWHLSRVQDDHIAEMFDRQQLWIEQEWVERFNLPFKVTDTGYGHTPQEVAMVRANADLLIGYHEACHDRTRELLMRLGDDDLDRVVDRRWDPPVTVGVRLVSIISDSLQHAGQAAFVRGVSVRRRA